MDNQKETKKESETNIYNVVILDQSGSMEDIKQEAISGYNETLQTIKAAQRKHAGKQNHFVTLVVFNSSDMQMVYDRIACTDAAELTGKTYRPSSCTPLYDAMGVTLSNFRDRLDTAVDYKVLVTIITDGLENYSKEYSGEAIRRMVTELKSLGWVFTYIGANHDVESFAESIAIPNALAFQSTKSGTTEMFRKESRHRMTFYEKVNNAFGRDLQSNFFSEDD